MAGMTKGFKTCVGVAIGLSNFGIFCALLYLFVARGGHFEAPWSGPDLVVIVLTAATLVLTCVALFVAVLAIWGYATIKSKAEEVASQTAREVAVSETRNAVRAQLAAAIGAGGAVVSNDGGSSDVRDAFKDGG